jgi:uncharacterized membrane protein
MHGVGVAMAIGSKGVPPPDQTETPPRDEAALETVRARASPRQPWWRRWFSYTLPGSWVALLFACLSFTPSLLPRVPLFQGVVTGVSAAIGYGLGVFGAWVWREFADRDVRQPRHHGWRIFAGVAAVSLAVSAALGYWWQEELRDLMGMPRQGPSFVLLPITAVVIFVLVLAVGRGLRAVYRWLARWLERWFGARAARATGWIVVVGGTWLVVSGVLLDGLISAADSAFAVRNEEMTEGVEQPTSGLRSGSPASLVPWETLGRQGRMFTAGGSSVDEIAAFTGDEATEPIRVFAGTLSAPHVEGRAELAVRDLERAGGFDRSYLMVATTTGSGWLVPSAVNSFEYITKGDSAIVAIQYSHLPSWLSYLVDQERAREAGRQLFDAVYERWSELPAEDRPKLLVFGESLGSFGGETAFSGEHDMANRTDGVLFVGPPSFNTHYREFTDDRSSGSPEVEPVFHNGRTVRFTNRPAEDVDPVSNAWTDPRVLYLIHPSDPIVWWSPDLLLTRPDWLEEPAGGDVLDAMMWIPFVTFWQVTADLPNGLEVPPGHGHVYSGEHVDGWVRVLQPPGWTEQDSAELRRIIIAEE